MCSIKQYLMLTIFSPFLRSLQIENIYKNAHASIRKDPSFTKKPEKKVTKKRWTMAKLPLAARKEKIAKHKADFLAKIQADVEA